MLPDYKLRDTVTIWNLVSRAPNTKDQLQRTTINRVSCDIGDARTLGTDGNYRTATMLTARIDIQSAEATDGRTYITHEEWDALYAQAPASIQAHWTIRPGFDFIGSGDIQDTEPATGSGAKTIGGRRDFKINAVNVKRTPDLRGYLKVTAT